MDGMRPGAKCSQLSTHKQTPHQTGGSDLQAQKRKGLLGVLVLFWNIKADLSEPKHLNFVEFSAFALSVFLK